MKFAIPFSLSAALLASFAWYLANRDPIELPPGVTAKHKTAQFLSSK